jgi:aspartate/glutamate racemase
MPTIGHARDQLRCTAVVIGEWFVGAGWELPHSRTAGAVMKHLGILAHSTEGAALCFLAFCQEGFRRLGRHEHPDVTLDYIVFGFSMPAWEASDHISIRSTLATSVQRLARAGADFFVCPDNTAHIALEVPGSALAIPGLHIVEVVADQAFADGRTRVGVLGTRYTMDAPLYPRALAACGIAVELPDARARHVINAIIFDELVRGVFTEASLVRSVSASSDSWRHGDATRSPWCAPRFHCWCRPRSRSCPRWTRPVYWPVPPMRLRSATAPCRRGAAARCSSGDLKGLRREPPGNR